MNDGPVGQGSSGLLQFPAETLIFLHLLQQHFQQLGAGQFFQFPGGGGILAFGSFLITIFCCCVLIDKVRSWLFVRLGINKAIGSLGNYISAKVMKNVD